MTISIIGSGNMADAIGNGATVGTFGEGDEAKARVAAFLESLDMRPRDIGGLEMTYGLEWAGILPVGLARNGAGSDVALRTETL